MSFLGKIGAALAGNPLKAINTLIDNTTMSKEEKEEFKLRAAANFAQFVKITEPDSQYVPAWANALRAVVRPLIALVGFFSYEGILCYLVFVGQMSIELFVAQLGGMVGMAVAFYFSDRQSSKASDKMDHVLDFLLKGKS